MSSFSERHGFKKPKQIQINSLDAETRHSLWNVCARFIFIYRCAALIKDPRLYSFARALYEVFYKLPVNNIPASTTIFIDNKLKFFQNAQWFEVLDIIEFICGQIEDRYKESFVDSVNLVLEREKSGF